MAPAADGLSGAGLRRAVVAQEAAALGAFAGVCAANQDAFDAAVTALALGARAGWSASWSADVRTPTCARATILRPELG